MSETSDDLKKQGNVLYQSRKFEGALECYNRAHALAPSDPSILANIAATFLECGLYQRAAERCREALALLVRSLNALMMMQGGETANPLHAKVRGRLGRALFFSGQIQEALSYVDVLDANMASACKSNVAARNPAVTWAQLPCSRSAVLPAYYLHGHDSAFSLLEPAEIVPLEFDPDFKTPRSPVGEQQFVPNSEITPEILVARAVRDGDPIRLYFGGVGDGRNFLTTIRDIDHALQTQRVENSAPCHAHLRLNDWHPSICARLILVLDMLYAIGQDVYAGAPASHVKDAALQLNMFLGCHYLIVEHHTRLCARMQTLCDAEDWKGLLPWLAAVDTDTMSAVKSALRLWAKAHVDTTFKEWSMDIKDTMVTTKMQQANTLQKFGDNKLEHARSMAREVIQYREGAPSLPPNVEEDLSVVLPMWRTADFDTLVKGFSKMQASLPELDNDFANGKPARREFGLYFAEEMAKWRKTLMLDEDSGLPAGAALQINPSFKAAGSTRGNETYESPFYAVFSILAGESVPWMEDNLIAALRSGGRHRRFLDFARIGLLLPMASAFHRCASRQHFEISLSCKDLIVDLHSWRCMQPDCKFDRIYVSNITDYTNTVPVFALAGPLLRPALTSLILYNNLVHPIAFPLVEHEIQSSTRIPSMRVLERLFGLKFLAGNSLSTIYFGPSNTTPAADTVPTDAAFSLGMDEFKDIVKQLFLFAAIPPEVAPPSFGSGFMLGGPECRYHHGLNLAGWLLALETFVGHAGFPVHWAEDVLQEIFSGTMQGRFSVVTKGDPPPRLPLVLNLSPTRVCTYPFLVELSAILGTITDGPLWPCALLHGSHHTVLATQNMLVDRRRDRIDNTDLGVLLAHADGEFCERVLTSFRGENMFEGMMEEMLPFPPGVGKGLVPLLDIVRFNRSNAAVHQLKDLCQLLSCLIVTPIEGSKIVRVQFPIDSDLLARMLPPTPRDDFSVWAVLFHWNTRREISTVLLGENAEK